MLNSIHLEMVPIWHFVDDVYRGAIAVKDARCRKDYLPPLPSERENEALYQVRLNLAHFENAFRPLIDGIVGIMQKNPAKVRFGAASPYESPAEVRDLDVYGNAYGDGLSGLKWRLNHAQALFGRYGLLLDVQNDPATHRAALIIREYPPEKILDGQQGQWYLLDESTCCFDQSDKQWKQRTQWRVLALDAAGKYYSCPITGERREVERKWKDFSLDFPTHQAVYPAFKGKIIDFIPMTVCNAKTIGIDHWELPPYYDAAVTVIDAYRTDSFYRKAIANHATPTLVIKNGTTGTGPDGKPIPPRMGGVIFTTSSDAHPADISILETTGTGLNALLDAKEDILGGLKRVSIQALLDGAGANSSGEAIQLRMLTGTASIAEIDQAGGKAIEEQLCFAACWAGADRDQAGERISYEIDSSYAKSDFTLGEIVDLMNVNATRGLLSPKAEYELLRQKVPSLPDWEDNRKQRPTKE